MSDHNQRGSSKEDLPEKDHPKHNTNKHESPKHDHQDKKDTPQLDPASQEPPQHESPQKDSRNQDSPKKDPLHKELLKSFPAKQNQQKPFHTAIPTSSGTSTGKSVPRDVVKIRLKIKHDNSRRESNSSDKSVHFRGDGRRKSAHSDDGSMVDVEVSADSVAKGLVDVAYFETLMRDKEPWIDHNYLSGFRNIFSADEVWLEEVYCIPCGLNTTYKITTKADDPIFYVKKTQTALSSWFKTLVCCPTPRFRNGFKVKIFSPSGTRLVTFIRKSHVFVTQLDIVETFYGKEEVYIGRIERSAHGYILRDKHEEDIYRVLQYPTTQRSFSRMSERSKHLFEGITPQPDDGNCFSLRQKEMKIFRSDTKEVVGRLAYLKRGAFRRFFSGCRSQPKLGFFCNPDTGTNAKILLMGVLFFLMHSGYEKHVDLPLGSDAVGHTLQIAPSSTSLDATAISDYSLDVLMKK